MSAKSETWTRLRAEKWLAHPKIASKNDKTAVFMPLADGVTTYNYDNYHVRCELIKTFNPTKFLQELAKDPNGTVENKTFDRNSEFVKRKSNRLVIGDIWDIDILGPDNGSIVLVKTSGAFTQDPANEKDKEGWFDIHTIECKKNGTHPECGAREFGFNRDGDFITFYTRGVSRPYTLTHVVGESIQIETWTSMMAGIGKKLKKIGVSKTSGTVVADPIVKKNT